MNFKDFLLFLTFFMFFCVGESCKQNNSQQNKKDSCTKTLPNYFAKNFSIQYFENYKLLSVRKPWQKSQDVEFQYVIIKRGAEKPQNFKKTQIIETPIRRVICLSTTHIALLDFINETKTIVGVSGKEFVFHPEVRQRIEYQEIKDVGFEQSLNIELLLSLQPDLVLCYAVDESTQNYVNRLTQLGIPAVYCSEFLETHPLGKAEWCKVVASFYEKENVAADKFDSIAKLYNAYKQLIINEKQKPVVLLNTSYLGKWFLAGGKSYTAQLISDAGGEYIWKENSSTESFVLEFETIFSQAKNADIWLNVGNCKTKNDILKFDERLKMLKSFKNNKIFNNNLRQNSFGGNDFFESGIMKPHLILKDLIMIFYNEKFTEKNFTFYKKLE